MYAGEIAEGKRNALLPLLTLAGSERRFQPGATDIEWVLSGPRADATAVIHRKSRMKQGTTRCVVWGEGVSFVGGLSDVLTVLQTIWTSDNGLIRPAGTRLQSQKC